MINEGSGDKLEGRIIGLSFPGPIKDRLYNEIFPELIENGKWTGELERITRSGKHISCLENFFIIENDSDFFIANISTILPKSSTI
ncbi:Uncharacterised protein [Candidatus Venteria ishoeyi]|uniref:Uncharacterized protein n=2 Tax=Candidatus Venteria ishoeyi TaxID=1899563 RepID=A0A1H6F8J0_9GAMM|nr:Uncharacterised protein [Candidatus Venteria ishoeyi]